MLSCRHIWKIYGRTPERALHAHLMGADSHGVLASHVTAVADVSFDVSRGETFVVMGLSGSGKSTLVRCIARLTEPTAGEVLLDGENVLRMSESNLRDVRRHKMAMVFQNFGLLPHRSVLDNVAFGLEVRGEERRQRVDRAMQMIDLVGLKGWERRLPRELSGGMQQRVGLARALAVDPELLLFDEPFSALDPLIRREMQDELLRLNGQLHKTSVFITHDFAEALRLGDHIAIMRAGRIVQVGTPQELVLHPADEYVAAFVKDAPRAKVLTAESVMRPGPGAHNGSTCFAGSSLESLLPKMAAGADAITVVDANGDAVGIVDRGAVLAAICPRE
jgi:glycine betaine/proline transport system ATP-binding protein